MAITPVFEQAAIQIDDVNIPARIAHGRDKQGGKFMVGFTSTESTFQIPNPGEVWKIQRHGFYWQLVNRLDRQDEHDTKAALNPGDVHIRVPGDLHVDAPTINTPGGAISATTRDRIIGDGVSLSYSLSAVPSNEFSVMIWKNGTFLHPDIDWTISGKTITFLSAPISTDKITVHYQRTGAEYRDKISVASVANPSAVTIALP